MMSDFRGGGGIYKNKIIEGKNRIKGGRGGGAKMIQKNWTSFMNDTLAKLKVKIPVQYNFVGATA